MLRDIGGQRASEQDAEKTAERESNSVQVLPRNVLPSGAAITAGENAFFYSSRESH
jgi:hypothetical protein